MGETRIGLTGASGRMGRKLAELILERDDCRLAGACDAPGAASVGQDFGALIGRPDLGLSIKDDAAEVFVEADAVIDFTHPTTVERHATLAAQSRAVYVVGTTGLGPEEEAALERAARHTAVVYAPNMSLGVTLLISLVEQVARALDPDYDIEIVEMHHRMKVDAPSGTALGLGKAAAKGRGVTLDEVGRLSREGETGARPRGEIGFATLRGGDVVGEHQVVFAAPGERIEIGHRATDRGIFARGAIKAALWGQGQRPGVYDMRDVLGLTKS